MGQLRRIARFGATFAVDRRYRNHVLDVLNRHVQAGEGAESRIATPTIADTTWLAGRKMFLVGGCELSYLKDSFDVLGVETYHTFDHGGAPEPLGEVSQEGSTLWTFEPDYIVLSQVQLFRGLIMRTQTDGVTVTRAEQERDVDELIRSLVIAIDKIRERAAAPIFVITSPLVYRPALGIHEYRSIKNGLSLAELLRVYELRLYETARSRPGVYVVDVDRALERTGKNGQIDDYHAGVYEHFTRPGATVVAGHLLRQIAALEPTIRRIKCAVVDLDGTLWSGVIREDGAQGVSVRQNYLTVLDHLSRRGIVLAICSKNDPIEAQYLPGLLGQPLFDKFIVRKLNWDPKSRNLRDVAAELNIGLDALAFFDDSAFERAEVASNAPQVLVLSDADLVSALDRPEFEPLGELTAEAATRTVKYVEQTHREAEESAAESLEAFLHSAQLELTFRRPSDGEVGRVHELLQRTNQLNATLRRTSLEQVLNYYNDPQRYETSVAFLKDKFGDYGLIGLAIAAVGPEEWDLLEFAFSCRAMGKQVEQALLIYVSQLAAASGAKRLAIDFQATDRNGQLLTILESVGFAPEAPSAGGLIHLVRSIGRSETGERFPAWLAVSHER
jgi:FkbH-like protein